ncbi:MAG TPA: LemA family protein [Candidatus Saccharimonadales bacterium]|nr:LemA family protein [Candidatus Saccharimonadales bacterium]
MAVIIIIVVVVVLVLLLAAMFNSLVRLNQQANEAFSDITVQLKRRYDLIPNLVNTVKGYASHEKTVFEDVTEARANAMNAQGVAETAKADNAFTQTMKSLFAVAENYPDLKASQNFQDLQAQLTDTEDKIQASRRFYNGVVRDFNTKRKQFPQNIFANLMGFRQDKEYYEVDEAQAAAVQNPVNVSF